MAAITKEVQAKLDNLRDAAHSGQLPKAYNDFTLRTIDGVYAAPGNFKSAEAILVHLATLTELINLYVNRS